MCVVQFNPAGPSVGRTSENVTASVFGCGRVFICNRLAVYTFIRMCFCGKRKQAVARKEKPLTLHPHLMRVQYNKDNQVTLLTVHETTTSELRGHDRG